MKTLLRLLEDVEIPLTSNGIYENSLSKHRPNQGHYQTLEVCLLGVRIEWRSSHKEDLAGKAEWS